MNADSTPSSADSAVISETVKPIDSDTANSSSETQAAQSSSETQAAQVVLLEVKHRTFVEGDSAKLTIVSDATRVTVNGRKVDVSRPVSVRLKAIGENTFSVKAFAEGMTPARKDFSIRRDPTTAEKVEIAAAAAVKKAEREAAAAAEKAEREAAAAAAAAAAAEKIAVAQQKYKDQAESISYNQLLKNPESYAGIIVTYAGQILQIFEGEGVMLVNVTNAGYGFWSDVVWVNYIPGQVLGAADDIVTFWGRVVGGRSYETQAGGENYVPEINARYIDG